MKQAKTLSTVELKRVLAVINANRHSSRNRTAFFLSFYAGLRVIEIASLKISDVFEQDQTVKQSAFLLAE